MKTKLFMALVLAVLTIGLNTRAEETKKINLVKNGNFESAEYWDGEGVIEKGIPMNGKNALKLDCNGKPVMVFSVQLINDLKPLTEYILSVDIKRTINEKGSVYAAVLEKAKESDKDWTSTHACGNNGQVDQWEHFEVKFTTGSEINKAVVILYNIYTTGIVWYANVSLVESKSN